jgi:hypothetical protein
MRGRNIPVIRNTRLADGSVLQNILGATKPGSKKLQFPYELPVIETSVAVAPDTLTSLYTVAGIIGGAIVLSQIIKRF